jgi:LysM repeat protein
VNPKGYHFSQVLIRLLIILMLAFGVFGGAYYAVHKLYLEPAQRLVTDKQQPPPAPPPDPSIEEFARCEELRKTSTPEAARTAFERFVKEFPESKSRDAALDVIGEINSAEFFSTKPNDSNVVVVKPGDNLGALAHHAKLSVELMMHLNHMQRDMIHPGQRLLTPATDFRIILRQKQRKVVLMNHDKFFRQYPALTWPGQNKPNPIILPKQSGIVQDKLAFGTSGAPVKINDPAYFQATHILTLNIPGGFSLYTQPVEGAGGRRPEGGGIALAPEHAAEIAILIPKGAPVTME